MSDLNMHSIVRAAMFGKQKQANVQLEAVVDILVDFFSKKYPEDIKTVHSVSDFSRIARNYLGELVNGDGKARIEEESIYIKLLCGLESYKVLTTSDIIPFIDVDYADPDGDSPKILFRITTLDASPIEDEDLPEPPISDTSYMAYTGQREPEDILDAEARVQEVIDKVAPCVPTDVAEQLGNDKMKMALYGAPTYFGRLS